MTAESPRWDESRNAWTTQVDTIAFGLIEVLIFTDGRSSPPTDRQLSTLQWIANLPTTATASLPSQARSIAEDFLLEEDDEDMSDDYFEIQFSTCFIPRLRDTKDHYCFMIGNSEIDEEHGMACLFKNEETCRLCHADVAYENYDWDDTALLDSVLRS